MRRLLEAVGIQRRPRNINSAPLDYAREMTRRELTLEPASADEDDAAAVEAVKEED